MSVVCRTRAEVHNFIEDVSMKFSLESSGIGVSGGIGTSRTLETILLQKLVLEINTLDLSNEGK